MKMLNAKMQRGEDAKTRAEMSDKISLCECCNAPLDNDGVCRNDEHCAKAAGLPFTTYGAGYSSALLRETINTFASLLLCVFALSACATKKPVQPYVFKPLPISAELLASLMPPTNMPSRKPVQARLVPVIPPRPAPPIFLIIYPPGINPADYDWSPQWTQDLKQWLDKSYTREDSNVVVRGDKPTELYRMKGTPYP